MRLLYNGSICSVHITLADRPLNLQVWSISVILFGINTLQTSIAISCFVHLMTPPCAPPYKNLISSGSKNAGILFRFPHQFPYFNGYGRSSATIFHVDVNIYILFIAKKVWVHYRELICFSKNLILEQIEIFQFCLKIRHLWRLPHPWVGGWVDGWVNRWGQVKSVKIE